MKRNESKKGPKRKDPRFIAGMVLLVIGLGFLCYAGGIKLYVLFAKNAAVGKYLEGKNLPGSYLFSDGRYLPMPDGSLAYDWQDMLPGDETDGPITLDVPKPDAVIEVPAIELRAGVYRTQYVSEMYRFMRYGAGMYPGTAPPGTRGNLCMAAHRTGPSDFFAHLHKLKSGDEIYLYHEDQGFKYSVESVRIVDRDDWSVVRPLSYAAMTLTTCQAEGGESNAKRLVVRARMVGVGDNS
ncbi:MAG: sortase [Christensenellales bacterium]|jgi:LPXTG-site transpeptidase (sortase) family protein